MWTYQWDSCEIGYLTKTSGYKENIFLKRIVTSLIVFGYHLLQAALKQRPRDVMPPRITDNSTAFIQ